MAGACIHRLFYDIRRIAPEIISDLKAETGAAESAEDLAKAIANWAETRHLRPDLLLSLYKFEIQKSCTKQALPVPVHINIRNCLMWPRTGDPTARTFRKWVRTLVEAELDRQIDAVVRPFIRNYPPVPESKIARGAVWYLRYHILGDASFSEISRTSKKFLENEPGDHPTTCNRTTVVRTIKWFSNQLGAGLRVPDHGGRPAGRKDSVLSAKMR